MSDLPNGLDAAAMKVAVAWAIVEKSYSTNKGNIDRAKFVGFVNAYVEAERALVNKVPIDEKESKP